MNKNNINKIIELIQNKHFEEAEIIIIDQLKKKEEASVINLYGIIFLQQGKYQESIKKFKLAEKYEPNYFKSYNNHGIALYNLKKYSEACKKYTKAIELNPTFSQAHNNMGVSLNSLKKYNEAIKYFKNSIKLKFDFIDPYINLGNLFLKNNNSSEAINCFLKATKIKKNDPKIIFKLGLAYKNNLKYKASISELKLAIKLDPYFSDAYSALGTVYIEINKYEDAINCFKKAIDLDPNFSAAYHNLLFAYSYIENFSNFEYRNYLKKYRNTLKTYQLDCVKYNYIKKPKKIKIGFVSGDFNDHPVGYFLFDLIKKINKSNIETYAYSNKYTINDNINLQFKINFNYWREIYDKSDLEIINQIRNDGINILIDLSGHTNNNRLSIFANKPAPIQLTWIGCNMSTGVDEIDYIIGDNYSFKDSQKKNFVEKFWHMPTVLQCLSIHNLNLIYKDTPSKKNGFITFGSFNNITKLNDEVIKTWSTILKNVTNSKILLKNKFIKSLEIKDSLIQKFNSYGIEKNRIILKENIKSKSSAIAMYNQIDIALDPFPYNGVTTSHEAILMGVPILTMKGERPHSKMGESLNLNISMKDWIAKNNDDYIYKAINFSKDISKLSVLKKELFNSAKNTTSFNSNLFIDEFENEMWKIWYKFVDSKY